MFGEFLQRNINNGPFADYIPAGVTVGYAQVEPNHLSAQRTSQVYAQLPAAANIPILQQGQFVKYDYANGEVNFGEIGTTGEWMLVFNEIKLYREGQNDCEFAMIKDNYNARVYSPFGGMKDGSAPDTIDVFGQGTKQTRYYKGLDSDGKDAYTFYKATEDTAVDATKTYYTLADGVYTEVADPADADIATYYEVDKTHKYDRVTVPGDYYEVHYNEDPFHIEGLYGEQMMKEGTTMVPRVFKTNVGDIFTTNAVDTAIADLTVGDTLTVDISGAKKKGFLKKNDTPSAGDMVWQVVKIYTMPDHQPGVKIMRIA